MRFLFDHDVPRDLAYGLRTLNHEVTVLADVLPIDTPDDEIFAYARRNSLVLLTCNRSDFIPFAQQVPHAGIIIVMRRRSRALERGALIRLLDKTGENGITNNLNFA